MYLQEEPGLAGLERTSSWPVAAAAELEGGGCPGPGFIYQQEPSCSGWKGGMCFGAQTQEWQGRAERERD